MQYIEHIQYLISHASTNAHFSQVVGPIMELKPKILVHWNVVTDSIVMPKRGNSILFMPERDNLIKLVISECDNPIHHTTITNTSILSSHTFK